MNPIKLLYITNGINGSGGLERVLSIKTTYLADKLDYEVHVLVLNDAHLKSFYTFSSDIQFHSIAVSGKFIPYIVRYKKEIKHTISFIKPDIISVCDDSFKGMMFPLLFNTKIPVIYERHASFDIFIKNNKLSPLQKIKLHVLKSFIQWGASKFDKFIVLTNNNRNEWNLTNMQVIPNPLSFYPSENATLLNKKVIAVGNPGYTKGFDRLLLSWKKVIKKHPEWQLDIYRKKVKNSKLETLAKEYKIENTVHFNNPVNNIKEKYLAASIYALSSRSEGFGMVLIEAMACGVPCIAYDCPSGPKDIITHQTDGILVENGDTVAFANALMELIENQSRRIEMGKLAKENVQRYLAENIMPQWDGLFKNLIKNMN